MLAKVGGKPLAQRLEVARAGAALTKYNQKDGKSSQRWVRLSGHRVVWGDVKTHTCPSEVDLSAATALHHGAKSSAFYKSHQGIKSHQDWQCFTVVTKDRTLDLACDSAEMLIDWYLAIASLMSHSSEPLLDEAGLRARIEQMHRD